MSTNDPGALGSRLKALMSERGMNQSVLAKKAGIERSMVSRIISGKARAKVEHLGWIAQVLSIDVHELLSYADLSPDVRFLFDQLCVARTRILELECELEATTRHASRGAAG